MTEQETLRDMMAWVEKRIEELPEGDSVYYKNMKESLEWGLKTIKERHRPDVE